MTLNNKIKNSLLSTHHQEELEAIQNWKKQLENNIDELGANLETSDITQELKGYEAVDTDSAWSKVTARIPELSESTDTQVIRPNFTSIIYKVAAVMVLLIGAFVGFRHFENLPTVYESQILAVKTMTDGSTITLDKGTKLMQLDNRNYELDGRAYFNVAKDPEHPFTVKTLHGQLTVLGTQFNIWTNNSSTNVTVTEGKVKFTWLAKEYILVKGDVLVSNNEEAYVMHADRVLYDSWKDKSLKFKDDNLHFVLENIATYYKVELKFKDDSAFDSCKINSTYKEETIEQVLKELKVLVGLEYDFDGKTILAKSFNCN